MIGLDQLVHFLDDRLQGSAGIFFFDQAAGKTGGGGGLTVHHVNFSGGGAQRERVVTVGRGAAHDVMCCGGSLAQHHQGHGNVGLLDRKNQRLAQSQQFCFFGDISHIDAAGVLEPYDWHPVAAAVDHKFVHFDQPLAVQFAADARVRGVFRIILAEKSLAVANDAYQKAVHFNQPGVDFGAVIRTVFHVLAAVYNASQDFVKIVHLFLVGRQQAINVIGGQARLFRLGYAEKFGVVARHVLHVVLEPVEHPFLGFVYVTEKSGFIVMDINASRRFDLVLLGGGNQLLGAFQVKKALGGHTA